MKLAVSQKATIRCCVRPVVGVHPNARRISVALPSFEGGDRPSGSQPDGYVKDRVRDQGGIRRTITERGYYIIFFDCAGESRFIVAGQQHLLFKLTSKRAAKRRHFLQPGGETLGKHQYSVVALKGRHVKSSTLSGCQYVIFAYRGFHYLLSQVSRSVSRLLNRFAASIRVLKK